MPVLLFAAQVGALSVQLTKNVDAVLTTPVKQLVVLAGTAIAGVDLFTRRSTEATFLRFVRAHTR